MLRLLGLCTVVLFVAACATTPVKVADAKAVPADRIVGAPAVTSATPARIVVVRDFGGQGSANTVHFKIDGRDAVRINSAEKAELQLEPGAHAFTVSDWLNHFGETHVTLRPNETAHLRISYGDGLTVQRWEELGD